MPYTGSAFDIDVAAEENLSFLPFTQKVVRKNTTVQSLRDIVERKLALMLR